MVEFPVVQDDGCSLVRFEVVDESAIESVEPNLPLTASLIALWDNGECLMVFNRFRKVWELPGGTIDPGESPREAAVRELAEETGQVAENLVLAGIAVSWWPPANQFERLAMFQGSVATRMPFVANDEMTSSCWWDPQTHLASLAPIDRALAELCIPSNPSPRA